MGCRKLHIHAKVESPLRVAYRAGQEVENRSLNYYPFGMTKTGEWGANTSLNNEKYQYNGIEYLNDHGLNINMARYRMLDPSIGRWLGVDPAAGATMGMSPYNSMGNSPMMYSDPEGDIPLLVGAAIGVIANGIGNSFNKQPFFRGWGESAFFGAFGAGAANVIGGIASGIAGGVSPTSSSLFAAGAFQAGSHAVVSGAVSMGQGGRFGSGALSGGLSSVAGSFTSSWGTLGQYGVGAATGGFGAWVAGGDFWQGAAIGAIVTGLNHAAHLLEGPIKPPRDPITNKPYLEGYKDAKYIGKKGGRDTWVDPKGRRVFQWDYKKGEVEIFDKRGRNHKGGFDPTDLSRQISKSVGSRVASGYRVILPLNFPVCVPCIEWFLPTTMRDINRGL